jgi:hypothetical protein
VNGCGLARDPLPAARRRTTAAIHYQDAIFFAEFSVQPTGMVEMLSDVPIAIDQAIIPTRFTPRGWRNGQSSMQMVQSTSSLSSPEYSEMLDAVMGKKS